jgi:predicted HicB family RNase H-like nuclease
MKRHDLTDTVKASVNLPREVHGEAAEIAKNEGMSLNLLLVEIVREAIRKRRRPRKQPA